MLGTVFSHSIAAVTAYDEEGKLAKPHLSELDTDMHTHMCNGVCICLYQCI